MAKVSQEELEQLAFVVKRKIEEEFAIKHLSGNLANTIEVVGSVGSIEVIIPAQTYNMLLYQQKGVVVHTSHGSYASELDKEGSEFFVYPNDNRKGSFKIKPHNHIGFVDRVINEAIQEWLTLFPKYREKGRTDIGE